MSIADELLRAATVTNQALSRAQKFYRQRQIYEGDMDAPLIDEYGEANLLDSVVIPAARNIVDAGVSFLFGEDITFDVTESYGEDAQRYLERLWRSNRMPTRLLELAMHGAITGTFVFKFEPDPKDVRDGAHRFVIADPSYLDVAWSPHDVTEVLLYRFEYPYTDEDDNGHPAIYVWRQDIVANRTDADQWGRRQITSWTITNSRAKAPTDMSSGHRWIAMRPTAKWEQVGEPHQWDYTWAPVFAGPNLVSPNSWWGYSDIEPSTVRLIDSLNRAASNTLKTLRHFGHPVTIVKGATWPEDHAIGEPVEFAGTAEDVDVHNLEMQSDLSSALEIIRELRGEVYDAGDTPDIARGKVDNVGQLSGAAMRILYGPQLNTNGKKRRTYGDQIEAALRAALDYAGFTPQADDDSDADGEVHIVWPDPLPKNEKEDAEVAEIDSRIGFSKESLIERRGGDPEVEAERKLSEGTNDPSMPGMLDLITPPTATEQAPATPPLPTEG